MSYENLAQHLYRPDLADPDFTAWDLKAARRRRTLAGRRVLVDGGADAVFCREHSAEWGTWACRVCGRLRPPESVP